ncbi:MAG: peptide deformylase [Bacteriovoracaceae bacterium]
MALKELCILGNPVLRKTAKVLTDKEILSQEIKDLREDLFDTMTESQGIGIAAPQIGISKQLALIYIAEGNSRYNIESSQPLLTIFNPVITVVDESPQYFWEGCLSVPGIRGYVQRPKKIKLTYLDEFAKARELIAEDFLSTVIQHELDHLFGTLFVDRVKDTKNLMFFSEYEKYYLASEGSQPSSPAENENA